MKYQTQKGLTLVATLVAVFILTLSITGPLFIAQQSFTSAATARDRTTASFLAQEGIEYVRSVRDHNYLSDDANWLQDLTPCLLGSCTIVSSVSLYPSVAGCSGTCEPLTQTSTGFFGYQSAPETKFTRTISMTQTQAHEVLLEVEVSWIYKETVRRIIIEERLFNWL